MTSLKANFRQLSSDWVNVKQTLTLVAALPKFFRDRVTLRQAEAEIKRLLDTRVERFLRLTREQIYQRRESPYLMLLKQAGCEFSDLQNHVQRNGLEETLAKLAGEGVYLTSDEFKGKKGVVRGKLSFHVSPQDFERRGASAGIQMQSSGSRNPPVKAFSPLEWITLRVIGEAVFYAAHDLYACAHAVYEPVVAGRMHFILIKGKLGLPVDRWFSLSVPVHGALEDGYHYLNARVVAALGGWFGRGIANPEYLSVEDLTPVLEWILAKQQQGRNCCLTTVVSNATRIARAALQAGISLRGLTFAVSGEPLTQFKKKVIGDAGADVALRYGTGGGNGASVGCGKAQFIDEMHVPQTIFTVVQNPRMVEYPGPVIHPIMITSLHASAPSLLLNVENGDYATLISRDCGCPLEKVGFTQHIHTVRSFEKMTGEGMNYAGSDLFELLENIIPSEFGGGPGDYQLVEEEDDRGQTRLTLMVHPAVGSVDEANLLRRLQDGLAQGSRNHRFITSIWQDAGTFRIRRGMPYTSARGKTLPLYIKPKS